MRSWTLEEQLFERHFAMEDVPLRRVNDALDVMGQEYLALNDAVAKSGCELVDRVKNSRFKSRACVLPILPVEFVRGMAAEQVDDVFPGRGQAVIDHRRYHRCHERALRELAMTRVLVRGLQVLYVRPDVDVVRRLKAALCGIERGKPGGRVGGNIDFEGGRECSEFPYMLQEVGRQFIGLDELIKQAVEGYVALIGKAFDYVYDGLTK